ncbi:hypothetical protein IU501_32090 [Nocardia otitidiscaviarum]|uniref:terpene synthase family protein n=1 Tax=Nocardia otitidiscaviarum TaxID=1823 RepID=UPI000694CDC0|nr:hypothetical protein [Nocardia otitidiscaviarum]MBF6137618.1 hypothetical protein [Nocardia otitidiscaviarum]MBF6488526.1 hypothetical protein [Nocardia otitidiscaviarum]
MTNNSLSQFGRADVADRGGILPPIAVFCPIAPAIHPHADTLESRSMRWLAEYDYFGDSRTLRGTKSAEFAARVSPNGITERLQIAADWDYWGFAFDDRSDRGELATDLAAFVRYAHRLLRMVETPESPPVSGDPLVAAVANISARFAAVVTPAQHRRWVAAHRAWLFGVAAQIGATEELDIDRFLAIRLDNAAGEVVTATTELVGGYEVPDAEHAHPRIRALSEMARLIAALDNDLHSYAKTAANRESDRQNIVGVVTAGRRCDLTAGVADAIALRDRIMCRFLAVGATTRTFSSGTRQYVRDLEHVIRGNIDWAAAVPRYVVDGATVSEYFSISTTPADDSTHAPGIPCIDWWWDV